MSKQDRIRARAREIREAQERAQRRRRTRIQLISGLGGLVIVGLVVAIVFAVVNSVRGDDGPSGKLVNPASATADGAIPVGQATAPVKVDVYLDYMCPACGKFEAANADELDRLIKAGTVQVELHPMTFLDKQSRGTRYSTRAANAVATVADGAPDSVWAFNNKLFEHQPEEGTAGLSDKEIADLAIEAGVPQDVVDRFDNGTFEAWAAKSNEDAFKAGVEGTPTVNINGTAFKGDLYTPGPLTEAIEKAAGGAQ